MALFGKKEKNSMLDVIRCDEQEYLVWKWHPRNFEQGADDRENSIRYGSSLRVKDGEMAVFVYSQSGGTNQDYIVGPHDDIIKTANFPVLSGLVGMAFGGQSPFQAEVYFINLSNNVQILFGVPYFDVFDPRYPDLPIPLAVRGTITFNITDYKAFIKNNRLINFSLIDFKKQVKSAVIKYVKSVVINIPRKSNIPAVQLESCILEINNVVSDYISKRFVEDFGVNLKALDIDAVEINKESENYIQLKKITADVAAQTTLAQSEVNIENLRTTQQINAENMQETLRIQREEMARAQRLQTEQNFMGAFALEQQSDVMKTAAQSLGEMGGTSVGGGDGFNPTTMMAGMMMGGAIGGQMAGMMNTMGSQMNQNMQVGMNTPPPLPQTEYYVYINNQQCGPYNMQQLATLVQQRQLHPNTLVWKQGMPQWAEAQLTELNSMFNSTTPPPIPNL